MFGLTLLGIMHTAISLVAIAAGVAALLRDRFISLRNATGRVYIVATALVCLTGFGIFQHGGFGKPHALGIITLVILALGAVAGTTNVFGKASRYVEAISYSTTFFLHMIPGLTETFTRLPASSPVFASPDDPGLQKAIGVCFVLFLIGITVQIMALRARPLAAVLPQAPAA